MARVTIQGKQAQIAERTKVKAAIGIDGLSGSGKSGLALLIASHLADRDYNKIYAIDTENKSMLLYVNKQLHNGEKIKDFWHAPLTKEDGYSPFNYEYLQNEAIAKGCAVVIQDSYTHCWLRQGGVLDEVNKLQANPKYNKYTAWGHPDIVDAKNLIFELVRNDKIHVISTIRVKEAFAMQQGDNGKAEVVSLGEQEMQTDGLQYEFDLLLNMVTPGDLNGRPPRVKVMKSRYDILEKGVEYDVTKELLDSLKDYLDSGITIDELNERTRLELAKSISERANNNNLLKTVFINEFPKRKAIDLSLAELRQINAKFIELEYSN